MRALRECIICNQLLCADHGDLTPEAQAMTPQNLVGNQLRYLPAICKEQRTGFGPNGVCKWAPIDLRNRSRSLRRESDGEVYDNASGGGPTAGPSGSAGKGASARVIAIHDIHPNPIGSSAGSSGDAAPGVIAL